MFRKKASICAFIRLVKVHPLLWILFGLVLVCGSCGITLILSRLPDKHQVYSVPAPEGTHDVLFSPNGQQIATSDRSGKITLWNAQTGEQLHQWRVHKDSVTAMAFNPTGDQLLSVSQDGTLRRWDLDAGEEVDIPSVNVLTGLPRSQQHDPLFAHHFQRVAWSEDGAWIVAASNDGLVFIFESETGKLLQTLQVFNSDYFYDTFESLIVLRSQGVLFVSGFFEGQARIQIWDLTSEKIRFKAQYPSHPSPWPWDYSYRNRAVFDPETNQFRWINVTTSAIETWSLNDDTTSSDFTNIELSSSKYGYSGANGPAGFALSADSELVVIGGGVLDSTHVLYSRMDSQIRLWRIGDSKPFAMLRGHTNVVYAFSFSPSREYLASVGRDDTLRLWDIRER